MIITLSGPPGAGTSTAARNLKKALHWPVVEVGQIFRKLAKKKGLTPYQFGQYLASHPNLDKSLDLFALKEIKKHKNIIWEGRLAGWLTWRMGIPAFRFWLTAPLALRLKRVQRREKISSFKAWREVALREKEEKERYLKLYQINLRDFSIYDKVISTKKLKPNQVKNLILKYVREYQTRNDR